MSKNYSKTFSQTFGAAGAIVEKNGKILLVKEKKETAKNEWNHPAGWIEVGEDPVYTVKKEMAEETGFQFEPTHILGIYSYHEKKLKEKFGITPHPIKIIFLGKITGRVEDKFRADEIAEVKWFLPEEIEAMDKNTLRDSDIKTIVKDYFAGKKYSLDLLLHTVNE